MQKSREKAIALHASVNHLYGGYPYILHLDAVETVHQEFKDELDADFASTYSNRIPFPDSFNHEIITEACYFHDSIEDCRQTYNNILESTRLEVAEIVYALTNEKGKTRAERANTTYYLNIRKTPGASFVKMCDRIANVRFSRLTGSSMFDKYKKENDKFMTAVDADRFPRMKECLIKLFE